MPTPNHPLPASSAGQPPHKGTKQHELLMGLPELTEDKKPLFGQYFAGSIKSTDSIVLVIVNSYLACAGWADDPVSLLYLSIGAIFAMMLGDWLSYLIATYRVFREPGETNSVMHSKPALTSPFLEDEPIRSREAIVRNSIKLIITAIMLLKLGDVVNMLVPNSTAIRALVSLVICGLLLFTAYKGRASPETYLHMVHTRMLLLTLSFAAFIATDCFSTNSDESSVVDFLFFGGTVAWLFATWYIEQHANDPTVAVDRTISHARKLATHFNPHKNRDHVRYIFILFSFIIAPYMFADPPDFINNFCGTRGMRMIVTVLAILHVLVFYFPTPADQSPSAAPTTV